MGIRLKRRFDSFNQTIFETGITFDMLEQTHRSLFGTGPQPSIFSSVIFYHLTAQETVMMFLLNSAIFSVNLCDIPLPLCLK